ncbi:MAG: 6-phosphogluconolactonase [Prolixibacteraceae bacterium]|jgi:6-phosphogluconolactonase|nr:6-phosphogluconolactonase [Prolixibacteraceae bacterium]
MKEPKYITYKTSDDIAKALLHWLEEWLSTQKRFPCHIAISGGSTPKKFFSILSKIEQPELLRNIHFWWVDERCVPHNHQESNYRYFKELFIDSLNFPSNNIHPVDGINDPKEEARRYAQEIEQALPTEETWPIFDLVLLGMGDDGHTASIFPDQLELLSSQEICEVAIHPITKQRRITLTGTVINKAKQVIFLVTGENKRTIFNQIKNNEQIAQQYPSAHIFSQQPVLWFIDKMVE